MLILASQSPRRRELLGLITRNFLVRPTGCDETLDCADPAEYALQIACRKCAAALAGEPIPPLPPLRERCDTVVRQIELSAQRRGERVAVLEARRHYCWYLKGVPHAGYYKEQIVRMNTLEDVYQVTKGIKRDLR